MKSFQKTEIYINQDIDHKIQDSSYSIFAKKLTIL